MTNFATNVGLRVQADRKLHNSDRFRNSSAKVCQHSNHSPLTKGNMKTRNQAQVINAYPLFLPLGEKAKCGWFNGAQCLKFVLPFIDLFLGESRNTGSTKPGMVMGF